MEKEPLNKAATGLVSRLAFNFFPFFGHLRKDTMNFPTLFLPRHEIANNNSYLFSAAC